MRIIESDINSLPGESEACVATIGFFDGVHCGHRLLLEQVKEVARKENLRSAVITFPVHPRRLMHSGYTPELLLRFQEKMERLEQSGVDYCFVLDFTPGLSALSSYEFMSAILKDKFNVHALLIGYDHRFGRGRSEDFNAYCRYGEMLGMKVIKAKAFVAPDGVIVSSSAVRRLLNAGDVERAATYLGYAYELNGIVVQGFKLGRKLGFPTANLSPYDPTILIPANGVYAVYVTVEGKRYGGMLNIGYRPTVGNSTARTIEVHIFNFNSDIYGKSIRVEFVKHIRPEMKFPGKEALAEQLAKDARSVEELLKG